MAEKNLNTVFNTVNVGRINKLDFTGRNAVYYTRVGRNDNNVVESLEHIYKYVETAYPGTNIQRIFIDRGMESSQLELLLAEAEERKFDLVIVKNMARIKRNILIVIAVVEELKESGVAVYFETENLYVDQAQDILLTVLTAFVEEEAEQRRMSARKGWDTRRKNQIINENLD